VPITVPAIDDRRYQDLRDEALARIPVHNPEWTNFNKSDPGVTLVELFAFLTESLLYRANQIPERNRRKFLKLLGIQLQPAHAASGLVSFSNDRGPLETTTLGTGFELRAGQLAFRTDQGLDVLPIEGRIFYKREVTEASNEVRAYYDQLYASFLKPPLPSATRLYESLPLAGSDGVDLGNGTVDGSLWIALLARKSDVAGLAGDALNNRLDEIRERIGSRTLTLGVVPWLRDSSRQLTPVGAADPERASQLSCAIPLVPADGKLPSTEAERVPRYRPLPVIGGDVLAGPGTVQIPLPDKTGLRLWSNLDPLEAGVGDFPPAVQDTNVESRVLTWLRLSIPSRTAARILWAGINAATVSQRARVVGERVGEGTGAPDQVMRLAKRPVLPQSVRLAVTRAEGGAPELWTQVEDLTTAGAEVPVPDLRLPPGTPPQKPVESRVFALDAEGGELRFGDGQRGARPPLGAQLVADYEYSDGREGNVNEGAIKTGPTLPPGFSVINPVRTWGGADAETVEQGEKQVQRWLQHRDRLVSAEDFRMITWRTPGVEIGRVDVIPAASPEFGANEPGDAPGAVTLVVLPRRDADQPDAPLPDRVFLDAICRWIDPKRLVTTEVFLRGPIYKKVWISVGIDVDIKRSIAEVRQAVEKALRESLAPLPPDIDDAGPESLLPVFTQEADARPRGWPLRKSVVALELAAVVARVPGVTAVRELLLASDTDTTSQSSVEMRGFELPRIGGLMVSVGPALPLNDLRGITPGAGGPGTGAVGFVPVPIVPEEC
jgi:hypothetical protein